MPTTPLRATEDPRPDAQGRAGLHAALGHLGAAAALAPPDAVAAALARAWAEASGTGAVRLWLVDHQHRWLRVPDSDDGAEVGGPAPVARAFRAGTVRRSPDCTHAPVELRGSRWGVLEVDGSAPDLDDDAWALVTATMATALQAAARTSDQAELQRRSWEYSVTAERQWTVLPPLEQHHRPLRVAALLEPAHVATSDLFDWSVDGDHLSACLVECAGDGVPATDTSLAVAAARQARRAGSSLLDQVRSVDDVLAREGAAGLLRGVFLRADRTTCRLELVVAGAPQLWWLPGDGSPGGRLRLPTGPLLGAPGARDVAAVDLDPGAAVLVLSDGVLAA
ncbi:SpoIIE family protein phosphatase, partial [Klenkia sp. PcliD-1-E]|uniref:SpoIIE family protein phosphatase n=1 Tax=Klenkia sp. PcliD-1-E TaxID=2954492 RepID=UPI002096CF6D